LLWIALFGNLRAGDHLALFGGRLCLPLLDLLQWLVLFLGVLMENVSPLGQPSLIFAAHNKMNSESDYGQPRKVVKLSRTPHKTTCPQQWGPEAKEGGIIGRERVGLMNRREGQLGDYYSHLENTVLQLEKAREFLECYRQLRPNNE
jgi:hypothetical protein